MRILLITYYPPHPPISGHTIRNYNLFRRVALKHQVWLLTFSKGVINAEYMRQLRTFCQDVQVMPAVDHGPLAMPVRALRYVLSGTPPDLRLYHTPETARRIADHVRAVDFDIVQIEDSYLALYRDAIPPGTRPRTVLTLTDVMFDRYDRMYHFEKRLPRKMRYWLHSRMMRSWEPRFAEHFDRCIAMSARDRDLLLAHNARLRIDVVPNGVDTDAHQPMPVAETAPALIFVGDMDYQPNVDAMTHFCGQILPSIRAHVKDVEMWIVGSSPRPEVRRLEGDGVHVTGRVADVRPYYQRSSVCVVPLRAGGGTRLKILEAMALGRPVVSSSIGCEGLDVVDGEHLLVADSVQEFVAKTTQLLSDQTLWQNLTRCARQLVVRRYDWGILAGHLMRVYDELVG